MFLGWKSKFYPKIGRADPHALQALHLMVFRLAPGRALSPEVKVNSETCNSRDVKGQTLTQLIHHDQLFSSEPDGMLALWRFRRIEQALLLRLIIIIPI